MPDGEQRRIGQRVADLRKARRLTQRTLAAEANVSLSLLQKVESGSRAATPMLVAAVAPVLRVSVRELYGQPFTGTNDHVHAAIPLLHGALARYDIPVEPDALPRSYELLRAAAGEVNRADRPHGHEPPLQR
jgi:transcriptional regulator with XRE-family HTH domain